MWERRRRFREEEADAEETLLGTAAGERSGGTAVCGGARLRGDDDVTNGTTSRGRFRESRRGGIVFRRSRIASGGETSGGVGAGVGGLGGGVGAGMGGSC